MGIYKLVQFVCIRRAGLCPCSELLERAAERQVSCLLECVCVVERQCEIGPGWTVTKYAV